MSKIGQYIKRLRESSGFNITNLANKADVSRPYLSQIESGKRKPSPEILEKLSKALDEPYIILLDKAGYWDADYHGLPVNPYSVNDNINFFLQLLMASHPFQGKIDEEISKHLDEILKKHNIEAISGIQVTKNNVAVGNFSEQLANAISEIEDDKVKFEILKGLQDIAHRNKLWFNEFYEGEDEADLYEVIHSDAAHYKKHKLNDTDKTVITAYLDGYFSKDD